MYIFIYILIYKRIQQIKDNASATIALYFKRQSPNHIWTYRPFVLKFALANHNRKFSFILRLNSIKHLILLQMPLQYKTSISFVRIMKHT